MLNSRRAPAQTDEAKARLNEITREAPDSLPAWRLLAQIAFTEGKLDESLKLLENITLRDPANIEAPLLQAQVWMAKGEVKKALETLESLNTRLPKFPPIKYQLARAYLQDNNAAQAAAVLNQAITANPDYAEAILLLGEINLQERRCSASRCFDAWVAEKATRSGPGPIASGPSLPFVGAAGRCHCGLPRANQGLSSKLAAPSSLGTSPTTAKQN